MSKARQRAYRRGLWAERLAAAYLVLRGYRILARRFRTPLGEIDLIAKRAKTIIFVEVKARKTAREAMDALSSTNLSRCSAAVDIWRGRFPDSVRYTLRIDAILIVPWRWPHHIANIV